MTIAQDHGFSYSPSDSSPDTNPGSMSYDDDMKDSFFDEKPHKSTSLASRKGSGPIAADKRATHNAIERARRESLNGRFMTLAEALPSMANVKRPSKSNIVNKALDFVYDAQVKEHKLIEENNMLRREVDQLRARLGMSPLPPPQPLLSPSDARDHKDKAKQQKQQQQQQAEAVEPKTSQQLQMFSFQKPQQTREDSLSGSSPTFSSSASMSAIEIHQPRSTPEVVDTSPSSSTPSNQFAPSPIDSVASSSPPSTVPGSASPFLAQTSIHNQAQQLFNQQQQQQQAFLQGYSGGGPGPAFMSPSLLNHQQSLMFAAAAQAAQFHHHQNQFSASHGLESLYGHAGNGAGGVGGGENFPWSNAGYSPFSPFVLS